MRKENVPSAKQNFHVAEIYYLRNAFEYKSQFAASQFHAWNLFQFTISNALTTIHITGEQFAIYSVIDTTSSTYLRLSISSKF